MPAFVRGLVGLLAVAAALAFAGSAAAWSGRMVGHVYVNGNTTGTNTISGFDRHADGSLTPIPGSPFAAGGAGTGKGLASQGSIQVAGDGRYVIAVDADSNQLSVLRIDWDGRLELVPGGVVSSDGVNPVSVAVHDDLVYVANAGAGPTDSGANYTGFVLSPWGQLRPLRGSTFALPDGAQPGDVLFNSTGRDLVGTRVGTSQIDSFRVRRDGRLDPAPGAPFAAQGAGPFGSEFRPTNPAQLFVSNAHNVGPGTGTVSAFSVAGDGTLNSIAGSPFPDDQTAPCWVEITHDGQFLFTVNTASGTISSYSIAPDGTLTLLPGSTPAGGPTTASEDARLSPDGRNLYVIETAAGTIDEFSVSGGDLTPFGSVPVSTGPGASGVAVS
jgi:6-phosphogluconolactonase